MTNSNTIDMRRIDGVYRRCRRYIERREDAALAYNTAWRRAWRIGVPMQIASHVMFMAAIYAAGDDIGTAGLLLVMFAALRHEAPRPPSWSRCLAAVPKYD